VPERSPAADRGAYHPRTEGQRARGRGLLGLREATAMAIGGMIGGGIFSVLGVTIDLAGHLAALSFVVGGAIAMLTARSYAQLALGAGRSGGPFTYLREAGRPEAGAWVAWLLIAGYVFALAVYAFTFGHYLANAIGVPTIWARLASISVLAAFLLVNIRGVSASGLTEDVVVAAKLVILGGVAAIGLGEFNLDRLEPLNNVGVTGVFLAAAVVFIAYEGFELLSYDYEDIERPRVNLPRALYVSVVAVAAVYVAVTLGAQMLVPDRTIIAEKEVAFAIAGQEALGQAGLWAATVGALLSTSSAINATLFSTARLARDVSGAGELPEMFGRERGGIPTGAIAWLAGAGAAFSLLPGITELVYFGSLTFLLVFGLINGLHAHRTARPGWDRRLAWTGAGGCAAAAVGLLYVTARDDPWALVLVAAVALALVLARITFERSRAAERS
jgi:amino acid transporter